MSEDPPQGAWLFLVLAAPFIATTFPVFPNQRSFRSSRGKGGGRNLQACCRVALGVIPPLPTGRPEPQNLGGRGKRGLITYPLEMQ